MTGRPFDEVTGEAMQEMVGRIREAIRASSESGLPGMHEEMEITHPLLGGVMVRLRLMPGDPLQLSLRAFWTAGLEDSEKMDRSLVGSGVVGVVSASQEDVLLSLSQDGLYGFRRHVRRFLRRLSEHGVDVNAMADEALVEDVMRS